MRPALAIFACCCLLTPSTRGGEPVNVDGIPLSQLGGFQIFRQGNQTTMSLGGALFPRQVRVTTATPEGLVVTRFTLPSNFQKPGVPPLPGAASALIRVEIPDSVGLVYVEGVLIDAKGTSRFLQSPPLPPGQACPLHLRAGWMAGDRILIEDKTILLRAGESTAVTFDGSRALSVPVPRNDAEKLPTPRPVAH